MKANGAPEKIYLSQERDEDGYYVDLMWHKHPYKDMENIQYVRTDAFIENSAQWLKENLLNHTYVYEGEVGIGMAVFLEDFKKAMKL